MDYREEAIIKIIGKTELETPGIEQIKLRNIVEEVLSEYEVSTIEKSLVASDIEERLNMYLAVKNYLRSPSGLLLFLEV